MKAVLRLLGVLGLLSLASCAKIDEDLKPVELEKFTATVTLKRQWSESIGSGQDAFYNRFRVASIDNTLFAADAEGVVKALDATTGKPLWQKKLSKSLGGAVGAGGQLVVVGSLKGEVVALNAQTGEEVWQVQTSSSILTPPQTDGQVVIAVTSDSRVFAFDAADGKKRWSYDHALPVLSYRTQSAPLVAGDQAFVGFDNGQMVSFALKDGQMRWMARVGQPKARTDLGRIADVDSTPILQGDQVFAASANGRVVAIHRATGKVLWQQNLSTVQDITLKDNTLVATREDSHVMAYNTANGELLWENKAMHRRNMAAPAVIGDYVAVVDDEDYLHLLSLEKGELAGRLEPKGAGFHSTMLTLGETLYILSDTGKLSAYRLAPPSKFW